MMEERWQNRGEAGSGRDCGVFGLQVASMSIKNGGEVKAQIKPYYVDRRLKVLNWKALGISAGSRVRKPQ